MSSRPLRLVPIVLALCSALPLTGCGRGAPTRTAAGGPPAVIVKSTAKQPTTDLGFPAFATSNTTRVASADPIAAAAGTARAVFPGLTPASRPDAVTLVDRRDWRTALAASVLMSSPVRAPLLFADAGQKLPDATEVALRAMNPKGSKPAAGAQVLRIGSVPRPDGRKTTDITGTDPFTLAAAIDRFQAAARGKTSDRVIIVSAEDPAFAAPAAGYAAKSGDPILFTRRDAVPAATVAALKTHQAPRIFVLGPTRIIDAKVMDALRKLGTVTRVDGADPVRNAIAFASFSATDFGWGITDPGHGLVFARADADPALAAGAAVLSASGTYGPLLLLSGADAIDPALSSYLAGIQPGYSTDPVRGVYNHGWLVGDAGAISPTTQAQLDSLLEIMQQSIPNQSP
jgi:hypothetical protein